MPVYQFKCPECTNVFDEKRSFARSGDPAHCPNCGSDRPAKVFASTMVFSPGSAAKAMLDPNAPKRAASTSSHGAGCPCCGGRQA